MKILIIDDEPKARKLLSILLQENCSEIDTILEAEDLLSGIEIIKKEKPSIVYLDIEMPEHSGLEILDFIDNKDVNFEIIFTTAYNEYALKAFQLSAIDYILKPLQAETVKAATDKAINQLGKLNVAFQLEELKKSLKSANFDKIGLPFSDGFKFVSIQYIIAFEADGMYTKVSTTNDKEILVCKPLRHFVEALNHIPNFYKPHRSYLINLRFIKEYIKKDGGYIVMDNNLNVSLSVDKKEEFLNIIQNIG
ncbi:LytR/AlgR family response regulator transcription factor [Flavobacterium okayamense]|uniref:DNA-binding response regulator n=1 Tax=Flavobacterium okayamense TaxID=2830782 RepID=A0ABM7S1T4_9FLAO|nr:LytTR family DNA-binding domain-containing protein [Flavobacterium okayamense]BCY27517.1 DNA-binding response regulator [Flavobacterium okayamense]